MQSISANGTAYTLTGKEGAPVVVLIHGLGLTHETWAAQQPALEADYQVLNYDLYGHGNSAPPPEKPTLHTFAVQLREVMDELSIKKAVLVGFSLGGMINRRVAIDCPERVSALAIFNSPHERDPDLQKKVEAQAAQAQEGGPGATIEAALQRWFTADYLSTEVEAVDKIRQWIMANDSEIYTQCRQVLAGGVVELIRPCPALTCPSLVITAEHDSGSTVAMSRAIAAEIAGAELHIVPNLKHMGLMEQPEAFLTLLQAFLGRLRG